MPRLSTRLRLTAAALSLGAAVPAWYQHWITAVVLVYLAGLALLLAGGAEHHDGTVRAKHEQARRAADLDDQTLAAPAPCCSFWRHSEGQVHGADCTRPPLARRDTYRLTGEERAAFDELAAGFDDRRAA